MDTATINAQKLLNLERELNVLRTQLPTLEKRVSELGREVRGLREAQDDSARPHGEVPTLKRRVAELARDVQALGAVRSPMPGAATANAVHNLVARWAQDGYALSDYLRRQGYSATIDFDFGHSSMHIDLENVRALACETVEAVTEAAILRGVR